MIACLTQLYRKNVVFQWTDECQKAFDNVKEQLANAVELAFPDVNRQFIVHLDASNLALGATLRQETSDGTLRLVNCTSRKFNDAERKFIRGLRQTTKQHVYLHDPKTLVEAMDLALHFENATNSSTVVPMELNAFRRMKRKFNFRPSFRYNFQQRGFSQPRYNRPTANMNFIRQRRSFGDSVPNDRRQGRTFRSNSFGFRRGRPGQDFRRSFSWTQRRNIRQNSGMHFSNNSLSLDTPIDRIQDTQLNVINRPNTGDRQLNETGARVGPRP
jgi:hypothetical protein